MFRTIVLACLLSAGSVAAQDIVIEELDPLEEEVGRIIPRSFNNEIVQESVAEAKTGTGAMVRGLDKLTGYVEDIDLSNGGIAEFGELRIELGECRHPEDNPTGEAFAYLSVYEKKNTAAPVFSGWMIASSPALSAMDHAPTMGASPLSAICAGRCVCMKAT